VWVVVHLYSGLALGAAIPAPYWALVIIVIVAHVLLDLIPHWDYTRTRHPVAFSCLDFAACLVTVLVGYFAFHAAIGLLVLGMLSAVPDADIVIQCARGRQGHYWFISHRSGFPHGQCAPLPGILVQAAVVAVSCVVLALV